MSHAFCRYTLRTTDVEGARAFYDDLLGPGFWGGPVDVVPLPPAAAARGALSTGTPGRRSFPPHWLGSVGVDDQRGRHVTFSWDGTRRCVGSVADIARLPHVHPQWLFFFRTDNLEESLARVRDLGGLTLPIATTPEGNLVAPCDDPQGAAFALFEVRAATPQSPTTKASSAIRRSC